MVTMDRQHSARLGHRLESNPEEQILPRSAISWGPVRQPGIDQPAVVRSPSSTLLEFS